MNAPATPHAVSTAIEFQWVLPCGHRLTLAQPQAKNSGASLQQHANTAAMTAQAWYGRNAQRHECAAVSPKNPNGIGSAYGATA